MSQQKQRPSDSTPQKGEGWSSKVIDQMAEKAHNILSHQESEKKLPNESPYAESLPIPLHSPMRTLQPGLIPAGGSGYYQTQNGGIIQGSNHLYSTGIMQAGGVIQGHPGVMQGYTGVPQGSTGILHGQTGVLQGQTGVIQGSSSGILQGHTGVIQGSSGLLQGHTGVMQSGVQSGVIQGSNGMLQGQTGVIQSGSAGVVQSGATTTRIVKASYKPQQTANQLEVVRQSSVPANIMHHSVQVESSSTQLNQQTTPIAFVRNTLIASPKKQ